MGAAAWFGEFVFALLRTFGRVVTLNTTALESVGPFTLAVPISVAVIGGASVMVGQSVVLAINKVTRLRSGLTMLAAGAGIIALAAVEALLASLIGRVVLGDSPNAVVLLPAVLLSFAPYWFGFLVALPYTGPGVARVLQVWQFLALWALLLPVLDAGPTAALLVAATAWLGTTGLNWLVEHSPLRLSERLFRWASGTPWLTGRDLMAAAKWEPSS